MILQQTNFQKQIADLPTQLDFLRIIDRRGSSYFDTEKKLFSSLEAGNIGEERVLQYIQKYGRSDWVVWRNVWLNHFGEFECDIILLVNFTLHIIEIKNYNGKFTYENGKCFFENTETKLNPIEQVRANKVDLQRILGTRYPQLQVKAAAVFAGDDNEVTIQTPVEDIRIVSRTGIKDFIKNIAREDWNHPAPRLDPSEILAWLQPYEIQNPFMPDPLTPREMTHIAGGIRCANCHSDKLQTSKLYVTCSCGLSESREEAILRTTCEYGVLTYGHDISRQALFEFFNGEVSLSLLRNTIQKHFDVVNKQRYSYCSNPNVLYEKLTPSPRIKRKRKYQI